jgi:hypothetical protein
LRAVADQIDQDLVELSGIAMDLRYRLDRAHQPYAGRYAGAEHPDTVGDDVSEIEIPMFDFLLPAEGENLLHKIARAVGGHQDQIEACVLAAVLG